MKKNLPAVIFLLFASILSFSQEGLLHFTKSYFRSNPFISDFSVFLNHLVNDPDLTDKKIFRRTDTSLYYFSGAYRSYNPFFFKPAKIEVTLEESIVQLSESSPVDTILVYHLLAYAGKTQKNEQDVKKAFDKIHRHYDKKFSSSNFQYLKKDSAIVGGAHNYFLFYTSLSPASVAWGKINDDYVLDLLLRIKIKENVAMLPATLYDP